MGKELLNEAWAQVVALHDDHVELAARDVSTCGRCAARTGCGHGLLDTLGRGRHRTFTLPRSLLPEAVAVGEELLLGVPQGAILAAAVVVYALPLTGFVAGALLASGSDAGALVAASLGLLLGGLLARRLQAGLTGQMLRCRRVGVGSRPVEAEPRPRSVV